MSNSRKHTPGKWRVNRIDYSRGEDVSFEIVSGDGTADESVGYFPMPICQTIMREIAHEGDRIAQDEVNLRLLSAAPELLEAAQGIARFDEDGYDATEFRKVMSNLKAAIAKATGGTR